MNEPTAIDGRSDARPEGVRAPVFPRSAFRELEAALSDPLFVGIPMGATLNDYFVTGFVDGLGDWRRQDEVAEALAAITGTGSRPRSTGGREPPSLRGAFS